MSVEIRVRCMNKIHAIVLADNGQLCLCDHDGAKGIEEINALMALGLGEPRCLQILNWWKQKKLTDSEIEKMPARLLKVWRIIRKDKRAYRLFKRAARNRKEPLFDDLTVAEYPEDIDTTVPDGIDPNDEIIKVPSAYRNLWDRKRHVFAVHKLVEELKRRGYNNIEYTADYKRSKNWKGELCGWYELCAVNFVDNHRAYCTVTPVNGTRSSFSFEGYETNIVTTKNVPYKFAADMVELQRNRQQLKVMRDRVLDDRRYRFIGIMDKLKAMYPSKPVTLETHSDDDYLHMKLHLKCKDRMTAAFIMDGLRVALAKLEKQDRVVWGNPPH
jgi:hypothetical protein